MKKLIGNKTKGLILMLIFSFIMQCFGVVVYAENDTNVTFIQGVVSHFDFTSGMVKIAGRIENVKDDQYITVLAVPGGTDMKQFDVSDTIFMNQIKVCENEFNIQFKFSKKPSEKVDIYLGGNGISSPIKTDVTSQFEYVLVDSIDVDVSNITATSYMQNFSDTDKAATMILAQYNSNGKLLDASIEEMIIPANTITPVKRTLSSEKLNNDTKCIKAFVWDGVNKMIPITLPVEKSIKRLKVLAVGNSFSVDSVEYLYQIAEDAGVEEIKIGNLHMNGCSLKTHWDNALNNKSEYDYFKNTSGNFVQTKSSIYDALKDEDWDIIVLQQVSGNSGVPSSYEPYLTNLKGYINKHKTNPKAVLAWNMTWAYQNGSSHPDFSKYNNDQLTMYTAITDTVQGKIAKDKGFEYIIPAGTAIQNMRTSYIGDNLTRDGYHLSIPMGRYISGLTWFKTLTGWSIDSIDYIPNGISEDDLTIIKEAVNRACEKPFEVTNLSYTDNDTE